MASGICVHNEIGRLRRVLLHRPGEELLNLSPANLPRMLFDDIPYLEVAQREHDVFAQALSAEGVEVCYIEDLLAEALDAGQVREQFLDQWLAESGLYGVSTKQAVKEYLSSIHDTRVFVDKCISGVRKTELELPAASALRLADLVGYNQDSETNILIDPMPNAYFTRDPFACVGRGALLNHMYSVTRRRETIMGEYLFGYHPSYKDTPLWYKRNSAFHVEGGDVLNLGAHTLAMGISQRTEAAAIDTLAQHLFWGQTQSEIESIYAFNIPVSRAFMHLDTVFTQIDVDAFTIHPGIMGTLQVFRLSSGTHQNEVHIEEMNDRLDRILARALGVDAVRLIACGGGDPTAAAREQWDDGSNTLAIAPGKICVYQRNTVTNEALAQAGFDLVVIPSAELSRGRGGPRCMSMPLVRDELA